MNSSRVVVIGGGVIGACCALYLRRAGCDVTLLDRGEFGRACSHGNCGYVCPSHILPLAEPGAAANAFKALFKSNSPFYIRPRLDWKLWSWLLRFARRCNEHDMLQAAAALEPLLSLTQREYSYLNNNGLQCEWDTRGLLFVYSSEHEFNAYESTDKLLRERFSQPAERWTREQLLQREPALSDNVVGAWLYPRDAQLRPDTLMHSLRALLLKEGVEILEKTTIDRFETSGGKTIAVHAGIQRITADSFVVATGAWTPQFEKELGASFPIQPGKGYSLTYSRPANAPQRPMIFHEHRVACTTFATGFRLGSTMEFSGYDASLNRKRISILSRAAEVYLRESLPPVAQEEWFGWRPMTYDSLPIIGPAPRFNNVFIASGHSMLGITLAPATGRLIKDMVFRKTPVIDPTPYRVDRF